MRYVRDLNLLSGFDRGTYIFIPFALPTSRIPLPFHQNERFTVSSKWTHYRFIKMNALIRIISDSNSTAPDQFVIVTVNWALKKNSQNILQNWNADKPQKSREQREYFASVRQKGF